jgi:hypothetical protein
VILAGDGAGLSCCGLSREATRQVGVQAVIYFGPSELTVLDISKAMIGKALGHRGFLGIFRSRAHSVKIPSN